MADGKPHILIVDDANLVRRYYRQILEKAGYPVDEALNGLEALEKVLAAPPALAIVDVNMPQMDGLTFLATLRRQTSAAASTVPALITSTESGLQDIAAGRRAGANFYLVKPIGEKTLLEYVALMCGERE